MLMKSWAGEALIGVDGQDAQRERGAKPAAIADGNLGDLDANFGDAHDQPPIILR